VTVRGLRRESNDRAAYRCGLALMQLRELCDAFFEISFAHDRVAPLPPLGLVWGRREPAVDWDEIEPLTPGSHMLA